MNSSKILFIDTAHDILAKELESFGFQCVHYTGFERKEILQQLHLYEGVVIRSKIKLDKEALDHAVNLKFIARVGAGMENIDQQYAEAKGIVCLNAPEGNRDAVAEHAMGMILSLLNHLCRVNEEVRKGIWIRAGNRGNEIKGKTIAIIGYGNTGSEFSKRLAGFSATVLAYDKYKSGFSTDYVKEASMEEIFREADILSLHVPLTHETYHLVNTEYINRFEKPIWIINTSRGSCINTTDLMDSIDEGKVNGAALDVLECENLSFEDIETESLPEQFQRLFKSNKVILSPHIAGWTYESHYKLSKVLADKVRALYGL